MVRVPNRGLVRFLNLIIHYVNGEIFGTDKRWSVFRDGPLCEAVRYPFSTVYTSALLGRRDGLISAQVTTHRARAFRRGLDACTHVNSPHVNSYPCQLVPMSIRTTNRCQLVPQVMSTRTTSDVNSYPTRRVSNDLLPHNRCQLVPVSTRTHVNSYH